MPARSPLEPRKLPRQARARATVDAVLEATARILEEGGAGALNTNAVGERAGVGVGSLYQYFPSKDALVLALIRREHAALLAEVSRLAVGARTLDAGLRAMVRAAIRQQAGRARLARVLDAEERRLLPAAEARAVAAALEAALAGFLACRAPALPAAARGEAAGDLVAIARGMVDVAGEALVPDAAGLEERVAMALRGYLRARIARDAARSST